MSIPQSVTRPVLQTLLQQRAACISQSTEHTCTSYYVVDSRYKVILVIVVYTYILEMKTFLVPRVTAAQLTRIAERSQFPGPQTRFRNAARCTDVDS